MQRIADSLRGGNIQAAIRSSRRFILGGLGGLPTAMQDPHISEQRLKRLALRRGGCDPVPASRMHLSPGRGDTSRVAVSPLTGL